MSGLLDLFLNNLLPVFLAAGTGYALSRAFQIDPRPVAQILFYIFSPCLIFDLLIHSQVGNGEILRIMLFASSVVLLTGGLAWLAGSILRLERRLLAALLLCVMFMNAGNYGLPVVMFAFGETGLRYASLFFVANSIISYTLGVLIASLGHASLYRSIANLFKVPAIYAVVLAFVFMRTGWTVPSYVDRTIQLLSDASIPTMLVLLGLQFRRIPWKGYALPLLLANGMRLVVGPLIAIAISPLFAFNPVARQAVITESGMPTAVLTTVLATEYNAEPTFVTAAVFSSTLFSALTLTLLLAYLGA